MRKNKLQVTNKIIIEIGIYLPVEFYVIFIYDIITQRPMD